MASASDAPNILTANSMKNRNKNITKNHGVAKLMTRTAGFDTTIKIATAKAIKPCTPFLSFPKGFMYSKSAYITVNTNRNTKTIEKLLNIPISRKVAIYLIFFPSEYISHIL